MAIVKYKNQSGVTYAYESISVWDPVKKQSRPKRKYLGRVDEETGEIISTEGRRGRPKKNPTLEEIPDSKMTVDEDRISLEQVQEALVRLKEENALLQEENRRLKETLSSIYQQAASVIGKAQH